MLQLIGGLYVSCLFFNCALESMKFDIKPLYITIKIKEGNFDRKVSRTFQMAWKGHNCQVTVYSLEVSIGHFPTFYLYIRGGIVRTYSSGSKTT